MVKGISKQVIVLNATDRSLFDQAIFILSDDAVRGNGVSNEMLLEEANQLLKHHTHHRRWGKDRYRLLFAVLGAGATGILWLLTNLL